MLSDAERNHVSWFRRGRERIELDGVTVFLGGGDAVLAFPRHAGDLRGAVRVAREAGAEEVACWAIAPEEALATNLHDLGFQDGWQPHWMGIDPRSLRESPTRTVEHTTECERELPYSSTHHAVVLGGDVHHFVVREGERMVGHAVLNVADDCAGIYDMGVAPAARRHGVRSSADTCGVGLRSGGKVHERHAECDLRG